MIKDKNYIKDKIEEIILKDMSKHIKSFEVGDPDYMWYQRSLELFKLKLRLIKFYKSKCNLMSFEDFIINFDIMKKEKILSIKETHNFRKFIDKINELELVKNGNVYIYIEMQHATWFDAEKENIYNRIIQLEEQEHNKIILENF